MVLHCVDMVQFGATLCQHGATLCGHGAVWCYTVSAWCYTVSTWCSLVLHCVNMVWHCVDSCRCRQTCVVLMYTELSVDGTDDVWFINFYSARCSHCHQLAPAVSASVTQLGVMYTLISSCSWQYMSKVSTCIAPLMKLHLKALRYGSYRVAPAQTTPYLPLPCECSPDGATWMADI